MPDAYYNRGPFVRQINFDNIHSVRLQSISSIIFMYNNPMFRWLVQIGWQIRDGQLMANPANDHQGHVICTLQGFTIQWIFWIDLYFFVYLVIMHVSWEVCKFRTIQAWGFVQTVSCGNILTQESDGLASHNGFGWSNMTSIEH